MTKSLTAKIDNLFTEWDRADSPGCSIGVIRNGAFVYKRGYGMASLEHSIPISSSTVFDIGSTTKQFVALCVELLIQDGLIAPGDAVQKYIPEMPRYKYRVTIDNLIHHTSGIRDYLTLMDLAGMRFENEYPLEEILGLITRQKDLNFTPGSEFLYSNSGYLLLGEIVRRVSGLSLRAFAAKHIFSPLGMKNTHFNDNFSEIVKNKACAYAPSGTGLKVDMSIFDVVGDGGVNTTVEDMLLWDRNFYKNELGRGGRQLILKTTTPGTLSDGKRLEYAHGLFVTSYRRLKMISHAGAWMGYRSELLRFPEKKFSIVYLSNFSKGNPAKLSRDIADLCIDEWFAKGAGTKKLPVLPPPAVQVEKAKIGVYLSSRGNVVEIMEGVNGTTLNISGSSLQLIPCGAGTFSAGKVYQVDWVAGTSKAAKRLRVQREGMPAEIYSRLAAFTPEKDSIRDFAGEYKCKELGTAYQLRVADSALILTRRGSADETLSRLRRDLFKGGEFLLKFLNSTDKSPAGFFLSAGRVKNLYFKKEATS